MHARAATVQIKPGKMQEFIDIFTDSMAPVIETKKGFHGQYLMTNATNGKAVTFSFWDTGDDVLAKEYLSEEVRAKLGGIFAAPPDYDHYEVSFEGSAYELYDVS
jgi:heme-degrading monooxygenase HmoA